MSLAQDYTTEHKLRGTAERVTIPWPSSGNNNKQQQTTITTTREAQTQMSIEKQWTNFKKTDNWWSCQRHWTRHCGVGRLLKGRILHSFDRVLVRCGVHLMQCCCRSEVRALEHLLPFRSLHFVCVFWKTWKLKKVLVTSTWCQRRGSERSHGHKGKCVTCCGCGSVNSAKYLAWEHDRMGEETESTGRAYYVVRYEICLYGEMKATNIKIKQLLMFLFCSQHQLYRIIRQE